MPVRAATLSKPLSAHVADVRLESRVRPQVSQQNAPLIESLEALGTHVGLRVSSVQSPVGGQGGGAAVALVAESARVRPLVVVGVHVGGQGAQLREASLTDLAHEWSLARVRPLVRSYSMPIIAGVRAVGTLMLARNSFPVPIALVPSEVIGRREAFPALIAA